MAENDEPEDAALEEDGGSEVDENQNLPTNDEEEVNGSLVTSSNHAEVVKLIKAAGSYVALTLLGKNQGPPPGPAQQAPYTPQPMDETKKGQITAPTPASEDTTQYYSEERMEMLSRYLESEKQTFIQIQDNYNNSPSEKLKKELVGMRNRIKLLEQQIATEYQRMRAMPTIQEPYSDTLNENVPSNRRGSDQGSRSSHHRQRSSPDTELYSQISPQDINRSSSQVKRNRSDVQDRGGKKGPRRDNAVRYNGKRTSSGGELNRAQTLPGEPENDDVADESRLRASTVGVMDDIGGGKSPMGMNLFNPAPTNPQGGMFAPAENQKRSADIITMEDDFPSDQEMFDEHGPFDSLEELEKKPAHLAVFLHYLISNKDPSSLFFYLVIESFKAGTPKDMKKWSYEIYSTFIADNSPMKVEMISKETAVSIENDMASTSLPDDRLRNIFMQAQGQAVMEVLDLLAEFRRNRSLGLGSIFGDQQLTQENMERSQEIKIAEQILMPHLDRLMDIKTKREDKNVALASALSTFMRQIGVKVSGNSSLERCPSFATKEKKGRTRPSKKHVKGHQFQEKHYTSTAFCSMCDGLLWGIGNQGLCCQDCELNIHRNDVCIERLTDQCPGKTGRKARVSAIGRMIPSNLKPTSRGKGDDQDRQPVTSPTSGSQQTIVERMEEENEEIETIKGQGRVHNLISQFGRTADGSQDVFPHSGDEVTFVGPGEKGTKVQRSSSLKNDRESRNHRGRGGERRSKSGYPEQDRSQDDVDMDQNNVVAAIGRGGDPGSQSSLSGKSQESISSISEVRTYLDDSDMEAEQDTPNWQGKVDKDILKKLKPKEVKRQEIINELFHTERTHVRNLKVLDKVFYQPLLSETVLPKEIVMQIFPNLPELIEEHDILNARMKKDKRTSQVIQDVGNLLLERFDGESGKRMKEVSADFCINQRHCLEMIKSKQRKEAKLNGFITEAEADPLCRRLPLRGIISTQMQRLTKYPLFIQQLLKYTQPKTEENMKLEKALQCCKDLLDYVNQAVREADNRHRLVEIKSKTDLSPYERTTKGNPDEVNTSQIFHKLLYDSPITWKLSRNKTLDMHAMLLEDYVVLLQKQDDKFVLKFHSTSNIAPIDRDQSPANNKRSTHSPIIKLSTTLFREVATSKKAFFLISTSQQGPQIYELQAPSSNEKKVWMDLIKSAQENVKRRNSGRGANPMNLPQRPEYHHNLDKTQDSNSVNTPAERAQRNKVVMKTPEVVTQVPFTSPPAIEEQGDAATLLKKVLEEPPVGDADSRKSAKYVLSVLSRVSRLAKEKNLDQLVVEGLEKCHGEMQRVQTLHRQELRSVEEELSDEQLSVARQAKEIKRLEQELNQQTIRSIPAATATEIVGGDDTVVTDLDRSDRNRLSYSADSNNSSATDDSDIPEHDYEQVTEIAELRAGDSEDSSENTLQPARIEPIQAQVATEVVNTRLYDLQEAERAEQFVAGPALKGGNGTEASCIQEDGALLVAASRMESMQLSGKEGEEGGRSGHPENPYMTLAEAHSGDAGQIDSGDVGQYQAWEEGDRRTSIDTYEKVEDFVPPMAAPAQAETIGAAGFSSTSESLSSYVDDASGGETVESSRPGKPEGGASQEDEGSLVDDGARLRDSKGDESASTSTGSSSGSSRPNSMVSADSGSEDAKLDQSSATDGKDSEVSDDQAIQVKPTAGGLELVDDGAADQPPPPSPQEEGAGLRRPLLPSDSLDDPGTDVDNPMLGESLLIVESLSDLSIAGDQQEASGDGPSVDLEKRDPGSDGTREVVKREEVEEPAKVETNQPRPNANQSDANIPGDGTVMDLKAEGTESKQENEGAGIEQKTELERSGPASNETEKQKSEEGTSVQVEEGDKELDKLAEAKEGQSGSGEVERQGTEKVADVLVLEDSAPLGVSEEEIGDEKNEPDHVGGGSGAGDEDGAGIDEGCSGSGEIGGEMAEICVLGIEGHMDGESKVDQLGESEGGTAVLTAVEQDKPGAIENDVQRTEDGAGRAERADMDLVRGEAGNEKSKVGQMDEESKVGRMDQESKVGLFDEAVTTGEHDHAESSQAKETETEGVTDTASGDALSENSVQKKPRGEDSILDKSEEMVAEMTEVERSQAGSNEGWEMEGVEDAEGTPSDAAGLDQVKDEAEAKGGGNEGVGKDMEQVDVSGETRHATEDVLEGVGGGKTLEGMSGEVESQGVVGDLKTGGSEMPEWAEGKGEDAEIREGENVVLLHDGQGDAGKGGPCVPVKGEDGEDEGNVENKNGEVSNCEETTQGSQGSIGGVKGLAGSEGIGTVEEKGSDIVKYQPSEENPEYPGVSENQEGSTGSVGEAEKVDNMRSRGEDAASDIDTGVKDGRDVGITGENEAGVMPDTEASLDRGVSDSEGERSITVSETDRVLKVVEGDEASTSGRLDDLIILSSEGEADPIPACRPWIPAKEEYESDSDDGYEEMV